MMDGRSAALARNWWAVALRGVAAILFGFVALAAPGATMLTLAWVFGIYVLFDGVMGLVAAIRAAEHHERWGLLALEGVANLAMGAIVWFFPAGAILAFVLILAAWALITGALMLVSAFRLHGSHGRLWLALGGIASLVWGAILAASPLTGAVVLTWWLGAYAVVFGAFLLVLGVRLRGRHRAGPLPIR